MKTICVIGLGYIGLPTAAMFASTGLFRVVGVDINGAAVETVLRGRSHIHEPCLGEKVARCVAGGSLTARTEPVPADVFILAVPTPVTAEKRADLSFVRASAESLVPYLKPGNLVILESTVPPGTTRNFLVPLLEKSGLKAGKDLLVAHCPERVLPGRICFEMEHNNRIIGGINPASSEASRELYATFVRGEIYVTDATTAELAKLMENTYRDVNIALANEFARIGCQLGVDIWEAIAMANKHPRVNIHLPGPGVGGHCIAVDPWFIVEKAPREARLIRLAREINDSTPGYVAGIISRELEGIKDPKVTLLGITYKANVDDCRESPSLKILKALEEKNFRVSAYDPMTSQHDKLAPSLEEALAGSDLLVLLVDHDSFTSIDPARAGSLMRSRLIFDTKNMFCPADWKKAGFRVIRLGCGAHEPAEPGNISGHVM